MPSISQMHNITIDADRNTVKSYSNSSVSPTSTEAESHSGTPPPSYTDERDLDASTPPNGLEDEWWREHEEPNPPTYSPPSSFLPMATPATKRKPGRMDSGLLSVQDLKEYYDMDINGKVDCMRWCKVQNRDRRKSCVDVDVD